MITNYGKLQTEMLSHFKLKKLPLPLREDPTYYDGNIFFAMTVAKIITNHSLQEISLTLEQLSALASTNGVNDWWMDECLVNGKRDFELVEKTWNAINQLCYSKLFPEKFKLTIVKNPEMERVVNYYSNVINLMPKKSKNIVLQHLLAINLYQGLSVLQEEGMRRYKELQPLEVTDSQMLERMQIEKGGMMAMYIAPLIPTKFKMQEIIPSTPPTLIENYMNFVKGGNIYPIEGLIRYAVELGGIIQIIDDLEDCNFDLERKVISPENLFGKKDKVYLSKAILERVEQQLEILSQKSNLSPLHLAMFDATKELATKVAEYRSKRVLERDR